MGSLMFFYLLCALCQFSIGNTETCTVNTCKNGGTCSSAAGGSPASTVQCVCPTGFAGQYCDIKLNCDLGSADIIFVLDESASITSTHFEQTKRFIADILSPVKIGPQNTLVGLIKFSSTAVSEFALKTYGSKDELLHAIKTVSFKNGNSTHIAAGLFAAIRNGFTVQNGDRPDFPNIIILLTDGDAHDAANLPQAHSEAVQQQITIAAIGIGPAVKNETLLLCSGDKNMTFRAASFSHLSDIIGTVCEQLQQVSITNDTQIFKLQRNKKSVEKCDCSSYAPWLWVLVLFSTAVLLALFMNLFTCCYFHHKIQYYHNLHMDTMMLEKNYPKSQLKGMSPVSRGGNAVSDMSSIFLATISEKHSEGKGMSTFLKVDNPISDKNSALLPPIPEDNSEGKGKPLLSRAGTAVSDKRKALLPPIPEENAAWGPAPVNDKNIRPQEEDGMKFLGEPERIGPHLCSPGCPCSYRLHQ